MALTYDQSVTLFKAVVAYLNGLEVAYATGTTGTAALYDAVIAASLGDASERVTSALQAHRAVLSSSISPAAVRAALAPVLIEWALAISAPEGKSITPERALFRLNEYFVANSKSLNAREFTLGAVSAGGGNTGNGTIRRLSVDHDDFALEGGHAEVKTLTCRQDQAQVDTGEEVFEFAGAVPKQDLLVVSGSGGQGSLAGVTTRVTERYLANPTFSQWGTTLPTAGSEVTATAADSFTGWTLADYTKAKASVDLAYRDRVGVPSTLRISAKFTDNNTLTQTFADQKRPTFEIRTPYYVQFALYRKTSATGTVTVTFGASTTAFTVGSLSDDAWNVCVMTLDKRLYHKNFTGNSMVFSIAYSSAGASKLIYIDDIILAPMEFRDGRWWIAVGGSTPFKRGDTFSFTDTVNATRGKCSYWLHHRSGLCLDPASSGFGLPVNAAAGETVTDP